MTSSCTEGLDITHTMHVSMFFIEKTIDNKTSTIQSYTSPLCNALRISAAMEQRLSLLIICLLTFCVLALLLNRQEGCWVAIMVCRHLIWEVLVDAFGPSLRFQNTSNDVHINFLVSVNG